jgi:hypothetical protein
MTESSPRDSSEIVAVASASPLRAAARFVVMGCWCVLALAAPGSGRAQTIVRDIDTPARQPAHAQVVNQVLEENRPRSFALVTVPAGKRFVVEHVALRILVASTTIKQSIVHAGVLTQLGAQTVDHVLKLDKFPELDATRAEVFETSQPMRVYADAGTTVSVQILFDARGGTPISAIVNRLSVSGHFVDVAP